MDSHRGGPLVGRGCPVVSRWSVGGDQVTRVKGTGREVGHRPCQVTPGCLRPHQRLQVGLQVGYPPGEVWDRCDSHHPGDYKTSRGPHSTSRWSYPNNYTSTSDHWSSDSSGISPVPGGHTPHLTSHGLKYTRTCTNLDTEDNSRVRHKQRQTWCGKDHPDQGILQGRVFGHLSASNNNYRHSLPSGQTHGYTTKTGTTNHQAVQDPTVFTTTRVIIKNREFICLSSESSSSGNRKEGFWKGWKGKHKKVEPLHGSVRPDRSTRFHKHQQWPTTNKSSRRVAWSAVDKQRGLNPQCLIASSSPYGKLSTKGVGQLPATRGQYLSGRNTERHLSSDHKTHFKSNKVTPHQDRCSGKQWGLSAKSEVSPRRRRAPGRVLEHFNKAFDPGDEPWCESLPTGEVRTPPLPHLTSGGRLPGGPPPTRRPDRCWSTEKGGRTTGGRPWRKGDLGDRVPTRHPGLTYLRRILKLRKAVATSLLLTSIASDLDVMLHDLCRSIPYPTGARSEEERHLHGQHVERELELLEHYMDGLGQEDEDEEEEGSAGSPDREDSNASSELDFYSAGEEMDGHSSGFYFASSEADSPPPLMPAPPPPIMPGEGDTLEHPPHKRPIPLMERLIRTHALWYLPNIGRAGAVHLLQNKEIGNFLVRQSSRPDTMALSVRLRGKPRVEHYLVESTNRGLRLEGSFHHFSAIPVLIAYYCEHHRDELPVTLTLPSSILSATTHQELASLALLGQDFWTAAISPKKQPPPIPDHIIPYHTSESVAPKTVVTMATQVNTQGHQIHPLGTHLNGVTRMSSHTTSQKVTSSMCHKSEVFNSYVSSMNDPSNLGCCVSQSFHSQTKSFQNGLDHHSTPPRGSPQCLPSNVQNGHHVTSTSPKAVMDVTSDIYDIPCSTNSPPIIRPIVTKAPSSRSQSGQRGGYYGGTLEDRLSDYEDVWTNNQSTNLTFRPIQTARSVQELVAKSNSLDSEREQAGTRFSAVNPGYITDSCSERDLTDTRLYQGSGGRTSSKVQGHVIHHRQQRHAAAPSGTTNTSSKTTTSMASSRNFPQPPPRHHHKQQQQQQKNKKSEIHRNEVVIRAERKPDPVVFTFDLKHPNNSQQQTFRAGSEPREPPSRQPPTPPVRRHRLERSHQHRQHQHQQQQYAGSSSEPFEQLISRLNSSLGSMGAARGEPEGDLVDEDKHSVKLEPIASPRLLERRPHYNTSQGEIYENAPSIFHKTATLSRSHELLNAPTGVTQMCLTGQGAMGTGGPGYTRSLSLPRHLQDLSMAEQESNSHQAAQSSSYSHNQQHQVTQSAQGITEQHTERLSPRISQSFNEHFNFPTSSSDRLEASQQTCPLQERDACTPSPPVGRFPVYDNHHFGDQQISDEESTVEDLIADVSPDLTVQPLKPLTISNVSRMSEYDNVNGLLGAPSSRRTAAGSSVATYYCQPWDSSLWDDLLNLGSTAHQPSRTPPSWMGSEYATGGGGDDGGDHLEKASSVGGYSSVFPSSLAESVPLHIDTNGGSQYDGQSEPMTCHSEAATSFEWQNDRDSAAETTPQPPLLTPLDPAFGEGEEEEKPPAVKNYSSLGTGEFDRFQDISDDEGVEDVGTGSFRDRLMPFLGSKRVSNLQRRGKRNAGVMMRDYITTLADTKETTFGITIENFIKCTKEGSETNPHIVTRNVRQFMNGMKNYLIHHGEENLNAIIEEERSKLESDEFLNIDAIIEGALHKAVIKPLKHHVYQLFVEEYRRVGALKTLSDNIRYAQTKTAQELGIRDGIVPPEGAALEEIKVYLEKMQKSYSPLKKLENLLGATSAIYNSVQNHEQTGSRETIVSLGADDFLPLFVWVLVQCGMVSAEVEAEYMWGLLHPCLLAGEGGYYLTTLSSAVTALKNFKHSQMTAHLAPEQSRLPNISDLQGFMKILIPDELHDSIITKTLPVRPNMTARDVCTMIAHKFRITNPQDYGLYVLIDGEEERHGDTLSPQTTKADLICEGRQCVFAYKRNNAKFVWPVTISR